MGRGQFNPQCLPLTKVDGRGFVPGPLLKIDFNRFGLRLSLANGYQFMSNPSSDPTPNDSFADSGPSFEGRQAPSWDEAGPSPGAEELSSSVAVDMARLWVQRHQKATMLGAFAAGVFIGAMLRE